MVVVVGRVIDRPPLGCTAGLLRHELGVMKAAVTLLKVAVITAVMDVYGEQ